jgi:hypothetical protein
METHVSTERTSRGLTSVYIQFFTDVRVNIEELGVTGIGDLNS